MLGVSSRTGVSSPVIPMPNAVLLLMSLMFFCTILSLTSRGSRFLARLPAILSSYRCWASVCCQLTMAPRLGLPEMWKMPRAAECPAWPTTRRLLPPCCSPALLGPYTRCISALSPVSASLTSDSWTALILRLSLNGNPAI